MGFSQEAGYVPTDIETIMLSIMEGVNEEFGTSYTTETFVGTNFYKFYYALAQKLQENEVKTSEIMLKLQQYITLMNQKISRPVVTNPGLIEKFMTEGFVASVKPMVETDAGKINVAVDVDDTADDYAETKLEICTILKNSTVAGAVTQGTESETIVLSNGQAFDFKYHLPDRIETWLRLTVTLSENNQVVIGEPTETRIKLLQNIQARYQLGKNFEPQRYFSTSDAPWSSQVKLEWTHDDPSEPDPVWSSAVFDAEFDELFDIALERIELVED